MPTIPRPEGQLGYRVSGDGSPLTLLHGFTQTSEAWAEFTEALDGSRRVVAPDIRGHGLSLFEGAAPHTMAACTEDLVALWDELGIDSGDLLGYSMGGRLALHAAITQPGRTRSLILVSAHAGLPPSEAARRRASDAELAQRVGSDGVGPFIDGWLAQPLLAGLARRGGGFLESQRRARISNSPQGLAASLRDMGAGAMPSLWERLGELTAPTLVVAGSDDQRYVEFARRLVAGIPRARLEIVEQAGHAVPFEQPLAFADVVARFLDGPRPPSAPLPTKPLGRQSSADESRRVGGESGTTGSTNQGRGT